ncbi:MAG: DNA repair protein RecN [Muribaculaceae bacterium]|nr:DNA repair protein RecN [Muribaculaceae bacterium]
MLKNLLIRNYALIEHLDLEFGPGLTIITGETGAGKSIMLGALSLVMGGRADTKVISDGDSKSVVEALFTDVDPDLKPVFELKDIEWLVNDDGVSEMTIRREISASGRSRIFVNDSVVTLQTLGEIVPKLIDIHSQHANAKINDPAERLRIIDAIAGNLDLRERYQKLYKSYVDVRHQIDRCRRNIEKSAENMEFLRFQFEQLEALKPKKGELREIEHRFELLSDADEVKERLSLLCGILGDSERGVQSMLSEAAAIAEKAGVSNDVCGRLRTLLIEARDIFETVDDYNSSIDTDPATLARLSARMNLYYEAIKRFRVADADELVTLYDDVRSQIKAASEGDNNLPELEKEAMRIARLLKDAAAALSESRKKSAEIFSRRICEKARPLGLPNISFKAEVTSRKLTSSGADDVEFLCSFNKNGALKPVGAIASGGEIARLMLSLKAILAGHINLPTIIFDEVDTGVSGEIADKMGAMMKDIAADMQVIVITHLPQVAAKGDWHFKVYKTDADNRTYTRVRRLSDNDRVLELAAMISGSEVTEAALSAVKALLGIPS